MPSTRKQIIVLVSAVVTLGLGCLVIYLITKQAGKKPKPKTQQPKTDQPKSDEAKFMVQNVVRPLADVDEQCLKNLLTTYDSTPFFTSDQTDNQKYATELTELGQIIQKHLKLLMTLHRDEIKQSPLDPVLRKKRGRPDLNSFNGLDTDELRTAFLEFVQKSKLFWKKDTAPFLCAGFVLFNSECFVNMINGGRSEKGPTIRRLLMALFNCWRVFYNYKFSENIIDTKGSELIEELLGWYKKNEALFKDELFVMTLLKKYFSFDDWLDRFTVDGTAVPGVGGITVLKNKKLLVLKKEDITFKQNREGDIPKLQTMKDIPYLLPLIKCKGESFDGKQLCKRLDFGQQQYFLVGAWVFKGGYIKSYVVKKPYDSLDEINYFMGNQVMKLTKDEFADLVEKAKDETVVIVYQAF